jgi:hypothetical protein
MGETFPAYVALETGNSTGRGRNWIMPQSGGIYFHVFVSECGIYGRLNDVKAGHSGAETITIEEHYTDTARGLIFARFVEYEKFSRILISAKRMLR